MDFTPLVALINPVRLFNLSSVDSEYLSLFEDRHWKAEKTCCYEKTLRIFI